jgi:hypothetical protein
VACANCGKQVVIFQFPEEPLPDLTPSRPGRKGSTMGRQSFVDGETGNFVEIMAAA